jgi:RNase_H superfamily
MRVITFDIETEGVWKGNGDLTTLDITVVGVHDSETGGYATYGRDEFSKLWPVLERADALVGYNSDHFDIPILNRYYAGDLTKIKSIDLMKEVYGVLGRRLKLDNLAEATLGKKKSGNGLEAVKWWAEGLYEKVRAYCLDDVKITRELYEYIKKNGSVKYKDYSSGMRELKIDPSGWETVSSDAAALTHTLPF